MTLEDFTATEINRIADAAFKTAFAASNPRAVARILKARDEAQLRRLHFIRAIGNLESLNYAHE